LGQYDGSPHSRNLSDQQLIAIRETGGIVGVNFAASFLRPDGRRDADTPHRTGDRAYRACAQTCRRDGVGLGSDFDGAKIRARIGNAAGLQNLVQVMCAREYGEPLIEKLCFRNWLRVLRQTWENSPRVSRIRAVSSLSQSNSSNWVTRFFCEGRRWTGCRQITALWARDSPVLRQRVGFGIAENRSCSSTHAIA
jgi:Membrane dipeptidase (Peptidase family M19)